MSTAAWNDRLGVTEALEDAGWTGDDVDPLSILRHPSGAVWSVVNDSGDCGVHTPAGGNADFPGDVEDAVVIAAALAAAGQLNPSVTVPPGQPQPAAANSQEPAR